MQLNRVTSDVVRCSTSMVTGFPRFIFRPFFVFVAFQIFRYVEDVRQKVVKKDLDRKRSLRTLEKKIRQVF